MTSEMPFLKRLVAASLAVTEKSARLVQEIFQHGNLKIEDKGAHHSENVPPVDNLKAVDLKIPNRFQKSCRHFKFPFPVSKRCEQMFWRYLYQGKPSKMAQNSHF